ncbi:MAG: respiratory nitrate reductase subunit gamma [Planctomycetes bacterium]|nr:respiratory nitrate reductase subunit gamma [Planctomycetota bacterium]
MDSWAHYLDQVLFAVLPYVAVFTLILVTIQRYRAQRFSYSSLSSQFLENRQHFWGLVPFHYGILTIIAGHVVAFLIPREILAWNSHPLRLYILELSALVFALMTLIGLLAGMVRRWTNPKIRIVTSASDWIIYLLLFVQIVSGIYVAVFYPWGSSWFSTSAAPYLWSLVKLNPDVSFVASMPHMVKLHIINAFLLIGFFPFTRLVHILVIPNPYLWRKPQVVRWYGKPKETAGGGA